MIKELQMINWRAYEDQAFKFNKGINFIMGPNGKGKTSILEAISFALSGESSIVDNKTSLLRDPTKQATVILVLEINKKDYQIERSLLPGKVGDARIIDIDSNIQLANSQKRVTETIEGLIGVSSDFLRRIVYMSEGDVFNYLQKPPGDIMNQQVRQVIGLTQLDQFKMAILQTKRELTNKSKEYKQLHTRLTEFNILKNSDLEQFLTSLNLQKESAMTQVLDLQNEISKITIENSALQLLSEKLNFALPIWEKDPNLWEKMRNTSVLDYYDESIKNINLIKDNIAIIENDKSRLLGQNDSLMQVIEILDSIDKTSTIPCPVCKKPMTSSEQHDVETETRIIIQKNNENIKEFEGKINEIKNQITYLNRVIESLKEIRNELVHTKFTEISPNLNIAELIQVVSYQIQNSKFQETSRIQNQLKKQIEDIENQKADFISLQTQLKNYGFMQPNDLQEAQIRIEERLIAIVSAEEAIEKTLSDMQNINLLTIYEQIASLWNNFLQKGKWHLKFDQKGNPILQQEENREFDFQQFSGGEKTALLVIIHTIIAHHFSNCKFLLIDEPLEHLDPINRRSLIGFFIAACHNNFFDQALITTYEESLIRKYISKDKVNILFI